MRLIDRLIWRELAGPLANSILMFLMLLFTTSYLFKMTDLLVKGASMGIVTRAAFFSLPGLVTETLGMGMLLGCLLAFGRLSGDSEHIALYASGVSFFRIARPVAWVGLALSLAAMAWNETVVPPAAREFSRLSQLALQDVHATNQSLHYVVKRADDSVDEFVSIDGGFDAKTKSLRRVTITKMSDTERGKPQAVVYAARVVARDPKGLDWDFHDGYVRYLRPDKDDRFVADTWFDVAETHTLPRNVRVGRDFSGIMQAETTDVRRMTFRQLGDKINKDRREGNPSTTGDEVNLWAKVSLPLATFIFGLVAAPLGVRSQRGGRTMGFGIAITIIFGYWLVHNWMFQVGKGGGLPPMLAAFAADILGIAAAILLIARTRQ